MFLESSGGSERLIVLQIISFQRHSSPWLVAQHAPELTDDRRIKPMALIELKAQGMKVQPAIIMS
jgi:hypothetical protein